MTPTPPRVVVTHPVFPETRRLLEDAGVLLDVNPGPEPWSPAELALRCAAADGLLAFMTERVDAGLLSACPRLRVIAAALKGFDNFDVEACTAAGVWLTTVPDLLTAPTAELALALALGLGRNLLAGDAAVRSGGFRGWRAALYGTGLAGVTAGIAGMGRVGTAIARRLAGFEPRRILAFDGRPGWPHDDVRNLDVVPATLEALLEESEVVFLALPLTPATRHAIGGRVLARVRPGCLLVNVGRGGVVDEEAVARALDAGRLGGYAADVFELEDWALPDRRRDIPGALLASRDRTLFTPHLGSAVVDVRREIEEAAARNLLAVFGGGRPLTPVNEPAPDAVRRRGWTPGV